MLRLPATVKKNVPGAEIEEASRRRSPAYDGAIWPGGRGSCLPAHNNGPERGRMDRKRQVFTLSPQEEFDVI